MLNDRLRKQYWTAKDEHLAAIRHHSLLGALTVYLSLLTELACQKGMDHEKGHAKRIGSELNAWPAAREIWELRYEDRLGS